jgi:hypothetical protein
MDLIDLEILVDLDYAADLIGGAQCGSAGVRLISLGLESFTHVTYCRRQAIRSSAHAFCRHTWRSCWPPPAKRAEPPAN